MLQLRKSEERGHYSVDWLNSYHTFSFSTYYDPRHMGFRQLRVINEDTVQPGGGFPTHPHRDMEIISLVLSGALKHEDDLGSSQVIPAGGVQLISAGTGIRHSEYNPSSDEEVHFLQIWIHPDREGREPEYQFAEYDLRGTPGKPVPIANPRGSDGAVKIHQDASIEYLTLPRGGRFAYEIPAGRHVWLQVADGIVSVDGQKLEAGDGLAVSDEPELDMSSAGGCELLLFDLA